MLVDSPPEVFRQLNLPSTEQLKVSDIMPLYLFCGKVRQQSFRVHSSHFMHEDRCALSQRSIYITMPCPTTYTHGLTLLTPAGTLTTAPHFRKSGPLSTRSRGAPSVRKLSIPLFIRQSCDHASKFASPNLGCDKQRHNGLGQALYQRAPQVFERLLAPRRLVVIPDGRNRRRKKLRDRQAGKRALAPSDEPQQGLLGNLRRVSAQLAHQLIQHLPKCIAKASVYPGLSTLVSFEISPPRKTTPWWRQLARAPDALSGQSHLSPSCVRLALAGRSTLGACSGAQPIGIMSTAPLVFFYSILVTE